MVSPADKDLDPAGYDDDFDADIMDSDTPLDEYDDLDDDFELDNGQASPAAAPVKAKKKTSKFTVVIIAIGVIVGGIILMGLFGGDGSPPGGQPAQNPGEQASQSPAATSTGDPNAAPVDANSVDPNSLAGLQALDQQQVQQGLMTDPAAPAADGSAPVPAQGFMNDPSQLAQNPPPNIDDVTPATSAISATPADKPAEVLPLPTGNVAQPQILPTAAQIQKAAPVTAAEPQPVKEQVKAANSGPTPRELELQSRLDETLKRLQAVEKKLAQPAPAAVTPAATGAAASSQEIAALRADLERLENKVDTLNAQPKTASKAYKASEDQEPDTVTAPKAVKKPAARKAANKTATTTSASSRASSSANKWELRGAQPGQAMLARQDGNDLRIVRVGDSISGIGQVTSISQSGGNWVVQGTSGRISE